MTWLIMSCSEPFSMTCTSEGCKSLSQVWACSCQTQRKDEGHTTKTGHLKLSQASTYALAHWRNFQIKNWSQKKLLHDFSCAMLRHSSRYWAASDSACNVFPRPISSAKRIRPSRRIPALTPCRNHPNKVRLWRKSLTLNLKCLILLDLKKTWTILKLQSYSPLAAWTEWIPVTKDESCGWFVQAFQLILHQTCW